jgi:hypothetical protein
MPSTDRKLELKANYDGSDRLTAVGVCQRVNFPEFGHRISSLSFPPPIRCAVCCWDVGKLAFIFVLMLAGCVPLPAVRLGVPVVPHSATTWHTAVLKWNEQILRAAHLYIWGSQLCAHDSYVPRSRWTVLLPSHPLSRRMLQPALQDGQPIVRNFHHFNP